MSEFARQPVSYPEAGENPELQTFLQAYRALIETEKLRRRRRLERAESACAALLEQYPDYVHALHTMGLILADQSRYEEALGYMHRALMLNPKDPKILVGIGSIYLRLESYSTAGKIRTLEEARARSPNHSNILVTLGDIYHEECEYERSTEALNAALDVDPTFSVAEMGIARNLFQIGELAGAAEICERHIREGSRSINHLELLSRFPASLVSLDVISLLDEAKPQGSAPADGEFRAKVAFSKATAFDRAGRYEEAWAQVCEARRTNSVEGRKSYKKAQAKQGPLLEHARNGDFDLDSNAETGSDHPVSLFFAGPSRAGKTTLERLVGSMPQVRRGYEHTIVENSVALTFQGAGFPTRRRLVELPPPLIEQFRNYYIEELNERAQSATVLTNTMPTRSEDALEAAAVIPNSRFVFVKRDIEDLSIRIFMKHYGQGNFYAWDLRDIRDHVTWYHQMIDIMAERMPHLCRVFTYDDIIADPAATLAQVAELCGLEMSGSAIPDIGDDRGCGAPYREQIEKALGAGS